MSLTTQIAHETSSSRRILIDEQIVYLSRIICSSTGDQLANDEWNEFAKCLMVLIYNEKEKSLSDEQYKQIDLFLDKLCEDSLCHMILYIYKFNSWSSNSISYLNSPASCSIYRGLCHRIITKDLNRLITCSGWLATDLWKCLHWMENSHVFMLMSYKIIDAFRPITQYNPVVKNIIMSTKLRDMAKQSVYGRAAFRLFIDQRIAHVKSVMIPQHLSWDYPYTTTLPGHHDVEEFLSSDHKIMYFEFQTFYDADLFAIRMGGIQSVYSVRATVGKLVVGNHYYCKMEKVLSRNDLLKKDVNDLNDFRVSLRGSQAQTHS